MNPVRIVLAPTRSRPVNIFLGTVLLLLSVLLLLALATYHAADPSLNTASASADPHTIRNWIGLLGAYASDLLFQILGLTAFLIPFWIAILGWSWARSRSAGLAWLRWAGTLLTLLFLPTVAGLVPYHLRWLHVLPIEGTIGRILADLLVRYVNPQGAWIIAGLLAAVGFYFASAFGLQLIFNQANNRWVGAMSLHDRWRNWREERAERKLDREELEAEEEDYDEQDRPQEARQRPPSRLAALFGRRRQPQTDLLDEVPAYQRARMDPAAAGTATLEDGSAVAAAQATTLAADEASQGRRRRSIWESEASQGAAARPNHQNSFNSASDPADEAAYNQLDANWREEQARRSGSAPAEQNAPKTADVIPIAPRPAAEPRAVAQPWPTPEAARPAAQQPRPMAEPWTDPITSPLASQSTAPQNHAEQIPERQAAQPSRLAQPYAPISASAPAQVPAPVPVPAFTPASAAPRPESIEINERADYETRKVTVAPKTVSGYKLPPSTLLYEGDGPQNVREDLLRQEAKTLEDKCAEFDVRGRVVQINPGPMVTTYEFKPEAGVKYSRVTGLSEDLCLAMRAESILIERMAGKSTVGIQVPNRERETIHLRSIIESETFAKAKSRLTITMGKDINGRIVTADLASMPHVLIAGSTGSGKSVAINAMITSLLYRTTPQQVRLILVDPKRVELGMYEGVPHLFTPIITEPKLAANALRNAVREMERRLKLLASRSVRNIDQYNKLYEGTIMNLFASDSGEEDEGPLPYIVIIIDELADLMMLDRANVEESITRLAQMARAVGIHLVLATQRPSVDVITGLIKANVPTRISFRLATKVDSRTILDTNGAESLLGRGDMLFLPPGTSRLMRLHAPYVSEKETASVVGFWKAQGEASYAEGFLDSPKDEQTIGDGTGAGEADNDPLYDDGVRLVFEFGKASTSLLQRRLRVGYGRAAHLIDMMERDGLVGPADGSRPRELLKAPGWLHEVPTAEE